MTTQRPRVKPTIVVILTVIVVVQTAALFFLQRRTAQLRTQMEQARLARSVDLSVASQLLLADAVLRGELRLDAVVQARTELDDWLVVFIAENDVGPQAAKTLGGLHAQHLDRWTEIWLMGRLNGEDNATQREQLNARGKQAARMILGDALGDRYTQAVTEAWRVRMGQ